MSQQNQSIAYAADRKEEGHFENTKTLQKKILQTDWKTMFLYR